MNRHTHQVLDDFFSLENRQARENYFRIRTGSQLDRVYPMMAEDERLTVTAILELPDPYKTELCHNLCGNPGRGINGTRRTFVVEPTGDEPIRLEMGTRHNQRQYYTLSKQTVVPGDLAINLLYRCGPNADIESQRGTIREVVPALEPEIELEQATTVDPGFKKQKK